EMRSRRMSASATQEWVPARSKFSVCFNKSDPDGDLGSNTVADAIDQSASGEWACRKICKTVLRASSSEHSWITVGAAASKTFDAVVLAILFNDSKLGRYSSFGLPANLFNSSSSSNSDNNWSLTDLFAFDTASGTSLTFAARRPMSCCIPGLAF